MEESKDARQELRAAVKEEGEPSFAQPLVRALYKTGDEDAPNKDSSQTLNVCCCQPNDGMGADFANGSQPLGNEPNNGNIERNDRSKMPRPPFAQTTNAEYGRSADVVLAINRIINVYLLLFRFGFEPLEEGGSTIRRIAYSKQHKIGRLNAKHWHLYRWSK